MEVLTTLRDVADGAIRDRACSRGVLDLYTASFVTRDYGVKI